jgi:AhpD family alkylhydroperoxidase
MQPRTNPYAVAPAQLKQFLDYSDTVHQSGLEHSLIELVKIRASQINGCANCLNMHTSDARKAGETEQRLHLLAAWHEAPLFSDRERAALDWTDHLTLIADKRAPDHVYSALEKEFSKEEQVSLTLLINVINGWNRLAVSFGLYNPKLGW